MAKEIRNFTGVEIRADEAKFQLVGTAVAYNTLSALGVPYGNWREKIAPGAFSRSLKSPNPDLGDVRALWGHDTAKVLGRQKNGSLTLTDSPSGLRYALQLDRNSQFHCDCFADVKAGRVDSLSFGFRANSDQRDEDTQIRTVTDCDLIEISFVAWPAYPRGTSAEARKAFVPQTEVEKAFHARRTLRKAAAMLAKAIVETQRRDEGWDPITDMASQIRCNLDLAHRFLEASLACSAAARMLGEIGKRSDSDGDGFDEDEGYREFKAAHVAAHDAIEAASDSMADCRLKASACKRLTVQQIKD